MKIAYFAPGNFYDLKQRAQHIAELLSKNNEIFYIEPTISSIKFLLKGGESFRSNKYDINSKLHIIRVNGIITNHKSIEAIDAFGLNCISERIQLRRIIDQCDIIWVGYAGWYNVIRYIKRKPIIFDKMDDDIYITTNPLLKKLLKSVEPKLISKSDIIFVTCQEFFDRIKPIKPNTYLIRNGVSINFKIDEEENINIYNNDLKKYKVFGYIGTISHWFDTKAIEIILEQNNNYKVVIVGKNAIDKIKHERIVYMDSVEKKFLPQIINTFDVCLYPFKSSKFLDTINPVKIYEYLAMNKPVVAVDSKETRIFGEKCNLYKNYEELKKICNEELQHPFLNNKDLEIFIKQNSWEEKVMDIEEILVAQHF